MAAAGLPPGAGAEDRQESRAPRPGNGGLRRRSSRHRGGRRGAGARRLRRRPLRRVPRPGGKRVLPAATRLGPKVTRPSVYEFAGGADAWLRLARAHHERCLADPVLNHPFSHAGQHPQHVERLAAYWAEVFGGPPVYSKTCGNQSDLVAMHSGNGDMGDLPQRFVDCFVRAADDAELPADQEFREVLRDYVEWAVAEFNRHPEDPATVPAGLAVPHWSWDGPHPTTS